MNIKIINLAILFVASGDNVVQTRNISMYDFCPLYKKGHSLNVQDVGGSWMTVYTQPKGVDCFKFNVRATMELSIQPMDFDKKHTSRTWVRLEFHPAVPTFPGDLFRLTHSFSQRKRAMNYEREQYITKYGDFGGRVDWNLCLLQVQTPLGKHFLMGNGTESGLMENVIIMEKESGNYTLLDQSADQWAVFGRRGNEVLIIRDCYGDTAAAFARAPYWPSTPELSAIFHRSGIAVQTYGRLLCEPQSNPTMLHKIRVTHQMKRGD